MRKILVFFALINLFVFSANALPSKEYDDFFNSLKLSDKQKIKIEQIEQKYNKKIVETNTQALLSNMYSAKYGNRKSNYNQLLALQQQLNDLKEEKEEEILSTLNWFQRRKYRKFILSLN